MIIKIAKVLISIAKIPAKVSAISFSSAGLRRMQARRQRKLKEWQHQSVSLQLKLACSRRRSVVLRESNNHQRRKEHSQEILDFMRDKFSKRSPNLPLQQGTSAILERMFELALYTAYGAYTVFIFERYSLLFPSFSSISDLFSGYEGLIRSPSSSS
jgi:hypothetical protein